MPLDLPTASRPTAATVRRRRAVRATIALVAIVLVAGAGIAYARSGSDQRYRTAVVTDQTVDQTLTGVATIEPVSQARVAFSTSGTVATVAVKPGDRVTAGQELATLDPTSLRQAVTSAQANLDQAQLTLEKAQTAQAAASTTTTQPAAASPQGAQGAQGAQGGTGNSFGAGPSASQSATPTSADITSYKKAVAAAEDQLAAANQAVLQASIASPIDGTVVAVNLVIGDTVSGGSTTATIVVTGDGGYEAVTMVRVTDLPKVKVGQSATVIPDGSETPIAGQVATIGLVATSGTSSTTYPVSITLSGDVSGLRDGATGTAHITTSSSQAGLAVPTSAVHVDNGGRHSVTVLEGNTTKAVEVEIGAVGSTWTAITNGLTAGQTVVLADLNEPLPSSATSSSNGQQRNFGGGGGGRFGGNFAGPTN